MRIPQSTMYRQFLAGLHARRAELNRALVDLADGKRIRVPSDDPTLARKSMELRARLVRSEGYLRSLGTARFDLATVDSRIEEAFDLLNEARTKAMSGASTTFEVSNDVLAQDIDNIREQLIALGNTQQSGRYLFAGTETLAPPFAADGSYAGNGAESEQPVDEDDSVATTVDGSRLFGPASETLAALEQIAEALRNDDVEAVQALIPDLTDGLDRLRLLRGDVGGRLQRIDSASERWSDERLRLRSRIADLEDGDLAEIATRISSLNATTDALSQASAALLGRSLFDYLG